MKKEKTTGIRLDENSTISLHVVQDYLINDLGLKGTMTQAIEFSLKRAAKSLKKHTKQIV